MSTGTQYEVIEARNPIQLKTELNKLSAQGYELTTILPYSSSFIIVAAKRAGA
jgi:hypothetical protein